LQWLAVLFHLILRPLALIAKWSIRVFYTTPLFRSRCVKAGRRWHVAALPHITGHTQIIAGDDLRIAGKVGIASGRVLADPTLVLGNAVALGHWLGFSINKEVVVEDNVRIDSYCYIADNDGHPRDAATRLANAPPAPEEILPVKICRGATLGYGSYVLKGVTVGEGATIRPRSIVTTDIPPHAIAGGNPARVISQRPDDSRT
jgi:acetyltransferase-like isoleucine patch superfamily enzyme